MIDSDSKFEQITKGARAIFNPEVFQYVKTVSQEIWNEPNNVMTFSDIDSFKYNYFDMIKQYKHSTLLGLDDFKDIVITDGVTGAFLDWYIEYGKENLVVLKGEYPFHERNGITVIDSYVELQKGQTLILSTPFSATGNIHADYYSIMEWCNNNSVNVLIDAAYLNISGIGELPVSQKCVKSVATSLSKVYNTGMNKIGLKFNKEETHTPYKQLNDWSYVNHHSINLHNKIMEKFSLSYIYDSYKDKQIDFCDKLGLLVSSTVIFGLSTEDKYKQFNRSDLINRLCISKELQNATST
ncbi:MAG: hypothetical protein CBC05_02350 [Crocinitomicaceae bacterium TMED45]|nr:MAG: hypothetical protein CBC05_02350 [Crocinitomicaceae bacterium TMED45]|tara:strand:+ start:32548 stop:33438 length:891 start_codon:yes stop_codon:yes gene_type:complete